MEKLKTIYEIVKKVVEHHSGFKNISIKGKRDNAACIRYIYYQLCLESAKEDYSHTRAAKTIKRDHNNSLYGINKFQELKNQPWFHQYLDIYNVCYNDLNDRIKQANAYTEEVEQLAF